MSKRINVASIGQQFMGRAHSNAFGQAGRFFDLPCTPYLHTVAGRDLKTLPAFAKRWGWAQHTGDWRSLARDPEIELVDIGTPNHVHREQAILMLEAGKHVCCEKPLAGTLEDARAMVQAARASSAKTFVWYNYRRCPAVALAKKLIEEGRLGRLYHVRAQYLQSWGGPETEMSWRFSKELAGSGAHGDLNAHMVDLARFLTGDEIEEIHGAVARTFVETRLVAGSGESAEVDVDDAVLFSASFEGGAVASFEASRVAGPHLNGNAIEINGSKGSIRFEFEEMNVLRFSDATRGPREAGWQSIMCTSAGNHPYAENWWPDGHVIGYEHTFVNHVADVMRSLGGQEPELALPDFEDAYQTQRVLEAALIAAEEQRSVLLAEVR